MFLADFGQFILVDHVSFVYRWGLFTFLWRRSENLENPLKKKEIGFFFDTVTSLYSTYASTKWFYPFYYQTFTLHRLQFFGRQKAKKNDSSWTPSIFPGYDNLFGKSRSRRTNIMHNLHPPVNFPRSKRVQPVIKHPRELLNLFFFSPLNFPELRRLRGP